MSKKLKIILSAVVLLVILAIVTIIQQHLTYEEGSRSFIFGQKLSYTQSQSMPFNGTRFTITGAKPVAFAPYSIATCDSPILSVGIECLDNNTRNQKYNDAENGKLQYQINLSAKDTSSVVSSLSGYRFTFDSGSVEVLDTNIDMTSIVPNSSKTFSLHIRVPQATKSVNLLVRNGNTAKYFTVSL